MSEFQNQWKWSKNVYFFETNKSGKLRLNLLSAYLQEIAWMHAEHLGFSAGKLAESNGFWVLTRMMIDVEKMPRWKDQLTIVTWPRQATGFFANRDFLIRKGDKPLIRATSSYVILHTENRRPVPPDFSHLGEGFFKPEKAIEDEIPKVHQPKSPPVLTQTVSPKPDEIDFNQHVNNTVYLNWCSNAISASDIAIPSSFRIVLNFTGEVFPEDLVLCELYQNKGSVVFTVNKESSGKIAFTGELIFN